MRCDASRCMYGRSCVQQISPGNPMRLRIAAAAALSLVVTACEGKMGPAGPAGPQGVQGTPGATGAQGPQGLPGPAGTSGLANRQDFTGTVGSNGGAVALLPLSSVANGKLPAV